MHRDAGPWTPAVHALLRHLEYVGFEGAPRVIGFDDSGREVLTYLEGDAGSLAFPSALLDERGIRALGREANAEADALASTPLGPLRAKPKPSLDELPLD